MTELTPLTQEQAGWAERGLTVVRALARVFAREWPGVPESDFVSVGHEAIVRAATRFDPARGVPFEQFVKHVTFGTMLDLAHRETFVHAQVRRVLRHLAEPVVVDDSADAWLEPRDESGHAEVVSSLRARAAHLATAALLVRDQAAPSAEDALGAALEERRAHDALRAAVDALSEDDRAFVRMHYEEDLTLREIAKRTGVVPRTASRVRDRITKRLARALHRDLREVG